MAGPREAWLASDVVAAPSECARRGADLPYHVDSANSVAIHPLVPSAAREFVMTSVPEELPDVVNYVLERADKSDLDAIAQAIDQRRREWQEKAPAAVTVNATVTTSNVFPTYLAGLTGVVKAITPGDVQYVTLTLDQASTNKLAASSKAHAHLAGRSSFDLPGIPLSCCRVTST